MSLLNILYFIYFFIEFYLIDYIINRYFLRLSITKKLFETKHLQEQEFIVNIKSIIPQLNPSLSMNVIYNNCLGQLDLDLFIFKSKFHIRDCIIGKVIINKLSIKSLQTFELHIIRKETKELYINGK